MKKPWPQINSVLLNYAVVPMLAFLLSAFVAHQLLRAKKGGDAKRFQEKMAESMKKFETGDREGALQSLTEASDAVSDDSSQNLDLAKKFEGLGKRDKAALHMEKMLRSAPAEQQNVTNYTRLTEYFLNQGDIKNARRLLDEDLLVRWPRSLEAEFIQGVLILREAKAPADVENALNHFKQCLRLNPDQVPSQIQLGVCYWRLGQLQEAEPILRRAQEQRTNSLVVLYHLGQVLRQQGKLEEAKRYLDEHERITHLQERQRHLEIQYGLGKYSNADLMELGNVYAELGLFSSAASTFRMYTRRCPTDPAGHRRLAEACAKSDDQEGARIATELANALSTAKQVQ